MNLREMSNAVLDATDGAQSAGRARANSLVNSCYFEVVRAGGTTVTTAELELVADQGDYSLSNLPILRPKYLAFTDNGATITAQPTSLDQIINLRGQSSLITSQTPYLFAVAGLDLLSLYPAPSASTTGTLTYFYRPDPLGSDADFPPDYVLPEEFHDLIVLLALSRSARGLNKGRNLNGVQMSRMYKADYDDGLLKLKRHVNRMTGSRTQTVMAGPPRRPLYNNDVYFSGDNL